MRYIIEIKDSQGRVFESWVTVDMETAEIAETTKYIAREIPADGHRTESRRRDQRLAGTPSASRW